MVFEKKTADVQMGRLHFTAVVSGGLFSTLIRLEQFTCPIDEFMPYFCFNGSRLAAIWRLSHASLFAFAPEPDNRISDELIEN